MDQKSILIADDDMTLLNVLAMSLRQAGFHVAVTQNPADVIDLARANKPDLLLLDIKMPGGTGLGVHSAVKSVPELKKTPVVYMTGLPLDYIRANAKKLGAYAVVSKPFDFATLLVTIREALSMDVSAAAAPIV